MSAPSLYVMKSENGLRKIGFSKNPRLRLHSIQCAAQTKIDLEYAREVPAESVRQMEKLAHGYGHEFRVRGEWFRCTAVQAKSFVDRASEWKPSYWGGRLNIENPTVENLISWMGEDLAMQVFCIDAQRVSEIRSGPSLPLEYWAYFATRWPHFGISYLIRLEAASRGMEIASKSNG